ncbi:ras gtpase-activating protein [Anaeramoeba flamelloides]|uniref:Ras gtpase-activating protein n=1 Tax=Anaeramoeba flamelloides TaxID=1746091 RepID=A0ABQ8XYA9_9EUKA|nr:ras gtpase-activating protein [Anaeramoeba flamelloides]
MSNLEKEIRSYYLKLLYHPKVDLLKYEKFESLSSLDYKELLKRWVLFQLQQTDSSLRIKNFENDLSDCLIFATILGRLFPTVDFLEVFSVIEVNERAYKVVSLMKQTNFKGNIPTAEDIYKGNERSLIKFLYQVAQDKPFLEGTKAIEKETQNQSGYLYGSDSSLESGNKELDTKLQSYTQMLSKLRKARNSVSLSSRSLNTKNQKSSIRSEESIEKTVKKNQYFPNFQEFVEQKQEGYELNILKILEETESLIDEKYLQVPENEEYLVETQLTELEETNEKISVEINTNEQQIEKLKIKLQNTLNIIENLELREIFDPNKEEKTISLKEFGNNTELFLDRFEDVNSKFVDFCNNLQTNFNLGDNPLLKGLLTKLSTSCSNLLFHPKPNEDHLVNQIFSLLNKHNVTGLTDTIKNTIKFKMQSIDIDDLQGVTDCMNDMIKMFEEKNIFDYNNLEAKYSMKSLFHYFLFVKSYKMKLSQALIHDVFVPLNYIEIENELASSLVYDIIEILNGFIGNYCDFKKIKEAIEELLQFLGCEDYKKISETILEDTKKEAFGETLRNMLLNILTEDQTELVEKALADYNNPDVNTHLFDDIFEYCRPYLIDFLNDDDIQFIVAIIDPNNCRDSIAIIAIDLYNFAESFGLILPFIKTAIVQEIHHTISAGTLFRSNDVATKMITRYALVHGMDYLYAILSDILTELCNSNLDFEVDPNKFFEEELEKVDLKQNMQNLKSFFNRILDSVFEKVDLAPKGFRIIANLLKTEIEKKFPDNVVSSIGGFIFLRFICPSIVSPKRFGLIKDFPPKNANRGLLLLSTVVQALSNGITFSSNRLHMRPINEDIRNRFIDRKDFLFKLASIEGIKETDLYVPFIESNEIDLNTPLDGVCTIELLKKNNSSSFATVNDNNNTTSNSGGNTGKLLTQEQFVKSFRNILISFHKGNNNKQTNNTKNGILRTIHSSQKVLKLNLVLQELLQSFESIEKIFPKLQMIKKMQVEKQKFEQQSLEETKRMEELHKTGKIDKDLSKNYLAKKWKELSERKPDMQALLSYGFQEGNNKVTKWKKRMAVLKQNYLAIFKKPYNTDEGRLSIIFITENTKISRADQFKKKNSFILTSKNDDSNHIFICDKSVEQENWMNHLRKVRSLY